MYKEDYSTIFREMDGILPDSSQEKDEPLIVSADIPYLVMFGLAYLVYGGLIYLAAKVLFF